MRQNATPFYLRGQSAESASQAKRAKLSDTNAPEILINDIFALAFFGDKNVMEETERTLRF
jgi:hypothetical protein